MSRKAVIVHSVAEAKAALAPGVPVLLLSMESAAGSVGPAWWREVVAAARLAYPATDAAALLDCGDTPGHAMAALAAGVTELSFHGSAKARQKLREMGADLRPRPAEALDLSWERDAERACRIWLAGTPSGD